MPACTFFGDSKCTSSVYPCLAAVIEELVATERISTFYVGDNGNFDKLVQKALSEASKNHPEIKCFIVLAYLPGEKKEYVPSPLLETIYPEGIEKTPLRFAINRRNQWILSRSDFVVVYSSPFGNSRKIAEKAFISEKNIIDLSDEMKNLFPFRS